jgi:hypothetical protein
MCLASAERRGLPAASDANHAPTSARPASTMATGHERMAARLLDVGRGPAEE